VRVLAFVSEDLVAGLVPGAGAVFSGADGRPMRGRIARIEPTRSLAAPRALLSLYGGPLAAQVGPSGEALLIDSVYRVEIEPDAGESAPIDQTGTIHFWVKPRSRVVNWLRSAWSVLVQESGG